MSDNDPFEPARTAEELVRLATETDKPVARVWYLEWAQAFRRLAAFGARAPAAPADDPAETDGPGARRH